jgi:lipopolysaccharide biosynthesis protein
MVVADVAGAMTAPKVLAFVLPQFHRIPENDAWWGEGFTEWTNVRKARPLFARHYQPRVPREGRYYDLLDPAVHDWQASLAQRHGIHGFCYYHYWFNGKQLLERPLDLLLNRGAPALPFCLAWANEPWTRAWDGGEQQVLMPQAYGDRRDWEAHFAYLARVFRDPRYIRVDGKPMFLIYRSASIDVCGEMVQCWRELAAREGLPGLHVVGMLTGFDRDRRAGIFDAFAEFEPMYTIRYGLSYWHRKREKLVRRATAALWRTFGRGPHAPNSYDYAAIWKSLAARPLPERTYPGAFVDWDNSARRGLDRSMIMRNFAHEAFASGMLTQLRKARQAHAEFVFINAWNEWAEGTYLEPDESRGTTMLEAVAAAVAANIDRGEQVR